MEVKIGTQSFTLAAYSLIDLESGAGEIRVLP
jgi:hypothetical protein